MQQCVGRIRFDGVASTLTNLFNMYSDIRRDIMMSMTYQFSSAIRGYIVTKPRQNEIRFWSDRSVFTVLHCMQHGLSDRHAVCPSVCPSVTCVNCDKTNSYRNTVVSRPSIWWWVGIRLQKQFCL